MAALAGVTLGPNGSSPGDFFYGNVRRVVANQLRGDTEVEANEQKRLEIENALKAVPSLSTAKVTVTDDGKFKVEL